MRVILIAGLIATGSAANAVELGQTEVGLRLALGSTPTVDIEHGEKISGGFAVGVTAQVSAPRLTRGGGPVFGLEGVSSGVDQEAGNEAHAALGSLNILFGWAIAPTAPLRLEATVFFGSGSVAYEDDHGDFDDLYSEVGGKLTAIWNVSNVWDVGLEGRYTHGRADLEDVDGHGRDGRLDHDGFSVALVLGISLR